MTHKRINFICILTIIVFTGLSYFNSLHNQFIWDDEFLIEKNIFITDIQYLPKILTGSSTSGFGGNDNFYRPTQGLFYLLIHSIFGKSKPAFHSGNILLHALNGILLFFLLLFLFKSKPVAMATSLLWVTHPMHTEAITYISGTADPMSLFFTLLALLIYPYKKQKLLSLKYGLAFISLILAIISKESMIIVPGLLFICIYIKSSRPLYWKSYIAFIPAGLLAPIYLILRKTILNFDGTYSLYKVSNIYTENILYRLYTYLAALKEYMIIIFWPKDLHMERRFPVHIEISSSVIVGSLIILLTFFGAYYFRKKTLFTFSWLWFFVSFIPMMGILIPINSFLLEHWLYTPSIGIILACCYILYSLTKNFNKLIFPSIILTLATTLSAATHVRNKDWKTPITFYSDILKYNKGTARIHNNIAMAYSDQNNLEKATFHYLKAIELSDTYPQTQYNLSRIMIKTHQLEKALHHLNRSLELDPNFIHSQKLRSQLLDFIKESKNRNSP